MCQLSQQTTCSSACCSVRHFTAQSLTVNLQFAGGMGGGEQPTSLWLWCSGKLLTSRKSPTALPCVIPTGKDPNLRLRKGDAEDLAVSGIHSLVSHLPWILSDTRGLQPTAYLKLSSYTNCHLKILFKWLEVKRKTIKHDEFCCCNNAFELEWPNLSSDLYLHYNKAICFVHLHAADNGNYTVQKMNHKLPTHLILCLKTTQRLPGKRFLRFLNYKFSGLGI